jgi:hypothetical protein
MLRYFVEIEALGQPENATSQTSLHFSKQDQEFSVNLKLLHRNEFKIERKQTNGFPRVFAQLQVFPSFVFLLFISIFEIYV